MASVGSLGVHREEIRLDPSLVSGSGLNGMKRECPSSENLAFTVASEPCPEVSRLQMFTRPLPVDHVRSVKRPPVPNPHVTPHSATLMNEHVKVSQGCGTNYESLGSRQSSRSLLLVLFQDLSELSSIGTHGIWPEVER